MCLIELKWCNFLCLGEFNFTLNPCKLTALGVYVISMRVSSLLCFPIQMCKQWLAFGSKPGWRHRKSFWTHKLEYSRWRVQKIIHTVCLEKSWLMWGEKSACVFCVKLHREAYTLYPCRLFEAKQTRRPRLPLAPCVCLRVEQMSFSRAKFYFTTRPDVTRVSRSHHLSWCLHITVLLP